MKRLITFLILIMYSVTTFGVGLQFHYCGNKVSSVQVIFTDEHSCSCGKGEMKPDCCKNEIKYFKVKSVHSKSSTSSLTARSLGIGLNAGHDLNLDNLYYFQSVIVDLLEVSIGHALICDALYSGLEKTIHAYLEKLKK